MDWNVILDAILLTKYSFEARLVVVLVVLILISLLFTMTHIYWKRLFYRIIRHPEALPVFRYSESLEHAARDLLFIFKLILIVYLAVFLGRLYSERPYLYSIDPVEYSRFEDAQPIIKLAFTIPVDKDEIKFNISPAIEGEWLWQKKTGKIGAREVHFIPSQSFFPGSHVVVYVTGIRQVWSLGMEQEQALVYDAPIIPWVREIVPLHDQKEVPIDQSLYVSLNGPIGDFIDLNVEVRPKPGDYKTQEDGSNVTIDFANDLAQGQEYSVEVYQTPRSYDVYTGLDIYRGETTMIGSSRFTTVNAPLIQSYSPQGRSVLAAQDISVVFDQEMDRESVEALLSITPSTEGEFEWKDNRTLDFKPSSDLQKNTEYALSILPGVESLNGGKTEEEITIKFKTIGPVGVVSASPLSGSAGLDVDNTAIVVEFDQEVDRVSAQEHFSISPAISGTYEWAGNSKMTFRPNGQLAYGTTYSYGIQPGVVTVSGLDSVDRYGYSFTTRENVFTLGVPYYRQEEYFTCNVAATRMTLAYRGIVLSEDDIQWGIGSGSNPNDSWVDGYGTNPSAVAGFIRQYRNAEVKTNWNVAELVSEVQKGNPVILWWYNRYSQPPGAFQLSGGYTGYNGMHSEVVRGFIGDPSNPTHILTNDPWRGQLTYTRDLFDSTWSYMGNTAVVVY